VGSGLGLPERLDSSLRFSLQLRRRLLLFRILELLPVAGRKFPLNPNLRWLHRGMPMGEHR